MSIRLKSSIYLLLGLLIITGISMFIFREPTLSFLSNRVFGQESTISELDPPASKTANIELKVLEKNEFKVLTNQIQYFDFDVVGKPVAQNAANINLPKWTAVYRGNFNPFPVPKPKLLPSDLNEE